MTAEWLSETYGPDVACCPVALAADERGGAEYLACTQILPAPELAEQPIVRRTAAKRPAKTASWEEALNSSVNPDLSRFYREWLARAQPRNSTYKNLYFKVNEKIRCYVGVRRRHAYVWQSGRFEGDEALWRSGLSAPETVMPVFESERTRCLRFHLITAADFAFFEEICERRTAALAWEPPKCPTGQAGAESVLVGAEATE